MMKKKKNITVIIIVIVSIVIVGGVLTWGFLTNWGQGKKSEPVKYTVTKKIPKGNKIEIENPESLGFKIGQEIEIGTGESRERRTIVGFGSLILDRPLTKDYPENTVITVVEEPIKKDFKVDNCKKYNVDLTCKECGDSYYLEDNKCKKYSYTENDCKGERKIFRNGTSTSNSSCITCGDSYYLEDNKCKKYSYTGTKDDCNKNKGIFTKGTFSSDQTCVTCGDSYYIEDNKCKKYTHTAGNCNGERKIFINGTSITEDNSDCIQCKETQWVDGKDCKDYTKHSDCVSKQWLDISLKNSTTDAKCKYYTHTEDNCKITRMYSGGQWENVPNYLSLKSGTATTDSKCWNRKRRCYCTGLSGQTCADCPVY